MWWTRAVRQTNAPLRVRSSRVVLIPRRWDQVSSMMIDKAMGANKPGTPGRARSSRSNHCAGNAGVISAYLCWPACVFFVLHAWQWVRRAPGIPCTLKKGGAAHDSDAKRVARMRGHASNSFVIPGRASGREL